MLTPTVESQPATAKAMAQVGLYGGKFSHDEHLPLQIRVKRNHWLGRRIAVTTTEEVWYRDAVTHIVVPAGFTYDLASIPRLMWVVISPWDIALESLFHDLLYRQQEVKRSYADYTLRSMMEARRVPLLIRWMVYFGVRLGGWVAWRRWRRVNAEAERAAHEDGEFCEVPPAVAPDKVEE